MELSLEKATNHIMWIELDNVSLEVLSLERSQTPKERQGQEEQVVVFVVKGVIGFHSGLVLVGYLMLPSSSGVWGYLKGGRRGLKMGGIAVGEAKLVSVEGSSCLTGKGEGREPEGRELRCLTRSSGEIYFRANREAMKRGLGGVCYRRLGFKTLDMKPSFSIYGFVDGSWSGWGGGDRTSFRRAEVLGI